MDRRNFLTLTAASAAVLPSAAAHTAPTAPNPFLAAHRGLFAKTLRHEANGTVAPKVLQDLGNALTAADIAALEALPVENELRLADPLAAASWSRWPYAAQVKLPPPAPVWDSRELAEEALELYWMALLRDVRIVGFERERVVAEAAAELSKTKTFAGVTPEKLFRLPEIPSAQLGYGISMLLWLPIPFGAHTHWQAYKTPFRGVDFLFEPKEFDRVQNGHWPAGISRHYSELYYLRTGRDVAEYVRWDFSYQAFLNAANILLADPHRPRAALHPTNPYKTARTQNGFVTLGAAELLALVARAADMALRAAWHVKWNVSGLLRPEEYGGLVERDLIPSAQFLKQTTAVKRVKEKFGTFLLPQSYPEGAPNHPAFPSGHATIAGACATVLKAFIDPKMQFRFPLEPTRDGQDWGQYHGPETDAGTEIDKLAVNMSVGRQWAGVHWRSDSLGGLRLGEHVGLAVLAEAKAQYAQTQNDWFKGFEVQTFDGKKVHV